MERPRRRHRMMDLGTALMVLAAAALLVESRLLPAWRARGIVEVGDRVPGELAVEVLATGDTLALRAGTPTLLLIFQSDCPACARAVPPWRRLLARSGTRVRALAVGLERKASALAWVRAKLPRALGARPLDAPSFLRRLAVGRVPATILVGPDDRLLHRRGGVPTAFAVDSLSELAADRARRPSR